MPAWRLWALASAKTPPKVRTLVRQGIEIHVYAVLRERHLLNMGKAESRLLLRGEPECFFE